MNKKYNDKSKLMPVSSTYRDMDSEFMSSRQNDLDEDKNQLNSSVTKTKLGKEAEIQYKTLKSKESSKMPFEIKKNTN